MLDLKLIINEPEKVKSNLLNKGVDLSKIDEVIQLGNKRSTYMTKLQSLEAKRNKLSKEIGILKSQGKSANEVLEKVTELKQEIIAVKGIESNVILQINEKLLYLPNLLSDEVPLGKDESENQEIATYANLGNGLVKDVKPHYEIASDLDIVDFQRAVKLSGTRFWAYKGLGAKLVRALENFMLEQHIKKGYLEWLPPVMVKGAMMQGTGQLPKFLDDAFKIDDHDFYLIPTAEVALTNLHHDEILDLDKPLSYTAFTPCFRAEAGSGGRDTRGLIRARQFNKVELVKFTRQENVEQAFKQMLEDAKNILNMLELPYRELLLCSGDTGFSAEKTIDLEVWLPSEQKYREISSVSSMSNFQGRRAGIRYKDEANISHYAYTLNGSALAIDRTIAAILENYQQPDGSVKIPKVLKSYMDNLESIGGKNGNYE